ncbi:hypothetical protein DAPPUDRAFT_108603 [Daphnia pulex]|uniref:Uncharacterized protein n=1 Tax=Daphnia pulex TaxID=6669 RepID=E9H0M8_DAPPU|nr:hypothetical protein DAPPUDRAFT_108603 [Daphnia pulex]|eukprot:EFX74725.1 hypothetical protein DAPPUDRAFT_108603 [Daphnia pulex]
MRLTDHCCQQLRAKGHILPGAALKWNSGKNNSNPHRNGKKEANCRTLPPTILSTTGERTKNGVASIFEETDIEFLLKEPLAPLLLKLPCRLKPESDPDLPPFTPWMLTLPCLIDVEVNGCPPGRPKAKASGNRKRPSPFLCESFPSSEEFDRHSHIDEDYFAEREQLDLASIADTNFKAATDMLTDYHSLDAESGTNIESVKERRIRNTVKRMKLDLVPML